MAEGVKAKFPFVLGPNSTSTFIKRDSKMQLKHLSNCKSCTTLKKEDKKVAQLESDGSGSYGKEKESVHQSGAVTNEQTISQPPEMFHPFLEVTPEASRNESEASLKDLCLADKRRIANLVEELARVSEEKEESVQRLKDEQVNFEYKIQQLEMENVIIEQERRSLQQQYRECQELLGLYQQYLSPQQAKLDQSIAQFDQPPTCSEVLSGLSRTSVSKASGSPGDGSHLTVAATGAQQTQECSSCDKNNGAMQMLPNPACLSCDKGLGSTGGPTKQCISKRRETRVPHAHHRCRSYQRSRHDTGHGAQDSRIGCTSPLANTHQDTFSPKKHERHRSVLYGRKVMASEGKDVLTRTVLSQEEWEQKRNKLLRQKVQLERERERLQARLAEQEERLNKQSKSCDVYSR